MNDFALDPLIAALHPIQGLTALVLGGSRAQGTAGPHSDYDLGLYYEPDAPLDIAALRSAIMPLVDDPSATVTPIGGWGPWINGGGWLAIGGVKVDLLYRDLARVNEVIVDARHGRFSMNYQPGHPHGFCSTIWMGEIATCRPLLDPRDRIAELKSACWPYPQALQDALIARFGWEEMQRLAEVIESPTYNVISSALPSKMLKSQSGAPSRRTSRVAHTARYVARRRCSSP